MSKPTIIITGANGFIGGNLVNYFFKKHWKIIALVHSIPSQTQSGIDYYKLDLMDEPNDVIFKNANYMVHCAFVRYEVNKNSDEINFNGTKILIDKCRKFNVKPLFISSFSAHDKAESHYGKSKLACEEIFNLSKDVVLKTGFVIGKKGMAAEIVKSIKKLPLIPLIGGGIQPLQTIYIDDLCQIIDKIFINNFSGIYKVAEKNAITMKIFYTAIAGKLKKTPIFIPIPTQLLYFFVKFIELFKIKLPISSESILGLRQLSIFETENDLKILGVDLKNYNQSLDSVIN